MKIAITKNFIYLLFLVIATPAFASEKLKIYFDKSKINEWESSRLEQFISDVEKITPQSVLLHIQKPIELKFADWSTAENSDKNFYLNSIDCHFNNTNQKSLENEKSQSAPQKMSDLKINLLTDPVITLNQLLFAEILKGPNNTTAYNCGLQTTYRLALGTVLKELVRLYDRQTKVSSDYRFLHLMTFTKDYLFFVKQKNSKSLIDPIELISPDQAYAINFVYFIFDKNFQCRRPTLYRYFAEKYKFKPYPQSSCEINRKVRVIGERSADISLDPERLYRVDYFLADAGNEFSSKYGHSMLRLIFCPPGVPLSIQCVGDARYDVVISFRANTTNDVTVDRTIDESSLIGKAHGYLLKNWDRLNYALKGLGLNGSYPSVMYLLSSTLIWEQYNDDEFRNVISTPLYLSDIEKEDLLNRVIEIKSGYEGSYQFFSNNCRSETEDLIKSVVRNEKIKSLSGLTPVGLRKGFYKIGLAKYSDIDENEFDADELHYSSLGQSLFEATENFKRIMLTYPTSLANTKIADFLTWNGFANRDTFDEFIKSFTAKERNDFILEFKKTYAGHEKYREMAVDLQNLELAIFKTVSNRYNMARLKYAEKLFTKIDYFKDKLTEEDYNHLKNEVAILMARINIRESNLASGVVEQLDKETQAKVDVLLDSATKKSKDELDLTRKNIRLLSN